MFTQQCEEMLQGLSKVAHAFEAAVASPMHGSTKPIGFIINFYLEWLNSLFSNRRAPHPYWR